MRKRAWLILLVVAGCSKVAYQHETARSDGTDVSEPSARVGPGFVAQENAVEEYDGRGWRNSMDPDWGGLLASGEEVWIIERPAPDTTDRAGESARGPELAAKLPGRDEPIPLPLKHTDVAAQITLYIAAVTVTQQYHNPYDGKIEAVYTFPLPDDAAVREFVMTVGDRRIRGIVREREEARQLYLEARAQGHVASLLTQERPNIFTQSVANIEPGKEVDIAITYFHTLRYAGGEFEFHFPMVVGPRFNPPGSTGGVGAVPTGQGGASGQRTEVQYLPPGVVSSHDIALSVGVDAGVPIEAIASPTHKIDVERPGESRASVRLSAGDRIPNRDFVLRYRVPDERTTAGLAIHRDDSGGYFALLLHPPTTLDDLPAAPREMVFVLDTSGSMSGEPLDLSKRAVLAALRRLTPTDTFQVITFDDTASTFGPAPVPATPENVVRAVSYVHRLNAGGGTMMINGIHAALNFPHDAERFRIVSFFTDGYIGNESEILGAIHDGLGASRIFSFGIGSSVNRSLIEGMARVGRGAPLYVTLDESGDEAVATFYRRVEHPALTEIAIDWGAMDVTETFPNPMPDLFAGRPVVVTGRFRGDGATTVRVSGRGGEVSIPVDLGSPDLRHAALPAVWARSKIASLEDRTAYEPDGTELATAIRETALTYGLVSAYTSFLAVDSLSETVGESGTTVVVPVPVPAGVKYETTVAGRDE